MNFPISIGVGPYSISIHFIFETLAFVIGFRYFLFLKMKHLDTISDSNRVSIIIGAIFGSFILSRILGTLENIEACVEAPNTLIYIFSSKTIVGGLIGGLIGVELAKKRISEKRSSGDLFTYPIILAMMIGRVGCFLSGVSEPTFGNATTFILGMNLGDGIIRHPVALYEIIYLATLWMMFSFVERKHIFREGIRFQLFMISYMAFRFFIEFIKPRQIYFYNLDAIQMACILCLLYYIKTCISIFTHPKQLLSK